jgi:hypothetical protein
MADGSRRFPPPWRADKIPGGYVVRDANGQALANVYSREDATEAHQAKMLTKDEARRVAVNITRLPELLGSASGAEAGDGLLPPGCCRSATARAIFAAGPRPIESATRSRCRD